MKQRKVVVGKRNYVEKIEADVFGYTQVNTIPIIEEALFNRNAFSIHHLQGALRDRFSFLMTFCGILRGESLFICELSDLFDVEYETPDNENIHALIMKIAIGKTNRPKTLYGRVIRHKNPFYCPIGALGFYLLSRFHLADETLDFSSNRTWFDNELLVESGSKNSVDGIKDRTFRKAMKEVFKKNGTQQSNSGIPSKHFVHFGRVMGAIVAELAGGQSLEIKGLGNWNPDNTPASCPLIF